MGVAIAIGNPGLEVVHSHAAGIDVGNGMHYVAVRPDRDPQPVRRFECFPADLHCLAEWLQRCGVKTVAMQSTGVYWIPIYEILEERGMQVYLVNARHTKNLPGRRERCAGEPMVAEIAHLRVVEQLVPTAFRDSRPSYLLATTGRARAWSGDVRSTYAESVDADERAISECNQRCERANRAGDHTVDHCRRA